MRPAGLLAHEEEEEEAFDQSEVMIAVSADIVEISGSLQRDTGFDWPQFQAGITFKEKLLNGMIPGLIKIGDFERQTQLETTLRLLETEGRAQLLSNPKIITRSGIQADFLVGGQQPYPTTNAQGVGVELKPFGVEMSVLPIMNPDRKDYIRAQLKVSVSAPDFSRPVVVGGTTVPSLVKRGVQTEIEIKSGETIVIGGFKQSDKNVTKKRIPFLGRIPILGLLFTTTNVIEEQRSLFLFVTMEVVK